MNFRWFFSVAILISMTYGCARTQPSPQTISGPESDSLLSNASGFIVMDQPRGGMVAVQLPILRAITIRPQGPENAEDTAGIHMLSGPDSQGRIAYIEDHISASNDRHLLKTILLDGTHDTELFSRPGGSWAETPAGHGEIGNHLALSPVQGRVAFLSAMTPVQMPSAYLSEGSLEMWDLEKKTGARTEIRALDEGLAWFPDGNRLAYVKLIDRDDVPKSNDPADAITDSFLKNGWNRVPAVFIRDLKSQTETFLHVGWRPIVSVDGSKVLICDREIHFYCGDVATGKASPLTGPGKDWPIAMLNANTLLAKCVPTIGTEVKFTENNSPLSGPKEMLAVKLARTDSQAFRTVIPSIDPRAEISFGPGWQSPGK